MILLIENEQTTFPVTTELEELLKTTIETALAVEEFDPNVEVSLTFVSADGIQTLNDTYRQKNEVTDVLSFPQFSEEGWEAIDDEPIMLGDIVICLERADQQAKEFGHSFDREVAYLVCHSLLHLLGYDHMTDEDKRVMRSQEKEIMKAMGLERLVQR